MKALKDGIDENQWTMLFLIRLVPVVPFFVANLIPALVGRAVVALRRFYLHWHHSRRAGLYLGRCGAGEVFARGETPNLGIDF